MSAVVVVTPEQLTELVRAAVREEVSKLPVAHAKEVMTVQEVAELLNRHPKVVTGELVKHRGLPVHYISAHEPRFKRAEVLAWLDGLPKAPKLLQPKEPGREGAQE